jgi:hypothetical protein
MRLKPIGLRRHVTVDAQNRPKVGRLRVCLSLLQSPSACLSIHQSVHPSIHPFIHSSIIYPSDSLYIYDSLSLCHFDSLCSQSACFHTYVSVSLSHCLSTVKLDIKIMPFETTIVFRIVFWDVLQCKIIVDRRFRGTCCLYHQGDETSVDSYFTRQYIPEDNSEFHTLCCENFKSHNIVLLPSTYFLPQCRLCGSKVLRS